MSTKLWRKPFDREEKATSPGRLQINKERCKGCSFCVDFCPRGSLKMSQELNSKGYLLPAVVDDTKCLNCGLCEIICPEFAMHVVSGSDKK